MKSEDIFNGDIFEYEKYLKEELERNKNKMIFDFSQEKKIYIRDITKKTKKRDVKKKEYIALILEATKKYSINHLNDLSFDEVVLLYEDLKNNTFWVKLKKILFN